MFLWQGVFSGVRFNVHVLCMVARAVTLAYISKMLKGCFVKVCVSLH